MSSIFFIWRASLLVQPGIFRLHHLVLERTYIPHDTHLSQLIDMVFDVSLDVGDVASDHGRHTTVGGDGQLSRVVIGSDFKSELLLDLQLWLPRQERNG